MRPCILIIVTCFYCLCSYGQRGIQNATGAKSAALGGISSVVNGSESVFNNFAVLPDDNRLSVLANTSRSFGLAELSTISLGLSRASNKLGSFGLSFTQYGFELYREQTMYLMYARPLRDNLSIGGKLGMYSLQIDENGSTRKLLYEISTYGSLYENLHFGFIISNPEPATISESTPIVTRMALGLSYTVSQKTTFYSEIEKELEQDISIKAGISYAIHPNFGLNAGYNTSPGQICLGFNWQLLPVLELQSAFQYHSLLGISPTIGLRYLGSQKDDFKR